MEEFCLFLNRKKRIVLLTAAVALITYITYLINAEDILTDTESYASRLGWFLNTFQIVGRSGMYLVKKLLHTDLFLPAVSMLCTIIGLCAVTLFFDYIVERIVEGMDWFYLFFNAFFITSPILTHQFYFHYQAWEVTLGMGLAVISAWLLYRWAYDGKSMWLAAAAACMIAVSIGIYQVLAPFAIAINLAVFFLEYLYGKVRSPKETWIICAKLILVFLAGLGIYFAFSKLWVLVRLGNAGSSHLSDTYVLWGKIPFTQCLGRIRGDIVRAGTDRSFSLLFFPAAVLFLVTGICGILRKRRGTCGIPAVAALVLLVVSPFLMSVVLGNAQIVRASLVFPFTFAFMISFLAWKCEILGRAKYAVFAALALAVINQAGVSMNYQQLTHYVYTADCGLSDTLYHEALAVYRDAIEAGAVEDPSQGFAMVFHGTRAPQIPEGLPQPNEATGISFFMIDPYISDGDQRITWMMQARGIDVRAVTDAEWTAAEKKAAHLPVWPARGSMIYSDGVIIVNLGE